MDRLDRALEGGGRRSRRSSQSCGALPRCSVPGDCDSPLVLMRRNRGSWRVILLGALRGAEGPSAEGSNSEGGRDALVYELLMLRQLEQNAMVWQTPALALTAEAFLLTIALGGESSRFARLLSSALSVVVAVLAMQLMAKHRLWPRRTRSACSGWRNRWGCQASPSGSGGACGYLRHQALELSRVAGRARTVRLGRGAHLLRGPARPGGPVQPPTDSCTRVSGPRTLKRRATAAPTPYRTTC